MAYIADPTEPTLPANQDQVFGAAAELRALKEQLQTNLEAANSYSAALFGATDAEIDAALISIDSVYTKAEIDAALAVIDAATLDGDTKEELVASTDNLVTRLVLPKGAAFKGDMVTPATGALKVTLPQTYTDTQISFRLKVVTGLNNESFDLVVTGYTDSTTSTWTGVTAYMTGSPAVTSKLAARFGNDTSKCCIYIGELGTTWTKLSCSIIEAHFSRSNTELVKWNSGWAINLEDAAFVGVTETIPEVGFGTIPVVANTLVKRDSVGDISARLFKTNYAVSASTPVTTSAVFIRLPTDDWIRPVSLSAFLAYLGNEKLLHADALRVTGSNIQLVKRNGVSETIPIGEILKSLANGAVGSFGFLRNRIIGTITQGQSVAGSSLDWSDSGATQGTALAGNWRALGTVVPNEATLFVRIS